ncbi:GNAT family N-acetyltransferase [Streptomyces sp. NPDC006879]|uniref:GNAT family N-acetyltransferase n=1 Tax=Streptomyces sp. NPDC006879 TaxID=3364767 RepID=UPI00369D9B1D
MEPITLTTARLTLRPLRSEDAGPVHAACQDPDIQRWTAVPSPYRQEHAEDFVRRVAPGGWRTDSEYVFAILLGGPTGPLVGATGLHRRSPGSLEIGYWAAPEHRGHGYLTEAVAAASRWAFTELGCGRVEWRAEAGNEASRAVAERIGFRFEGTLRGALEHRGTTRDCWVGGLLPSDLGLTATLPYLPARS